MMEGILLQALVAPVKDLKMTTLRFQMLPGCPGLPRYVTDGAAGMDLMAAEDVEINAGDWDNIKTGLRIQIPPNHELQIRSRSGLAMLGIQAHFGTIDEDYRGEIRVILFNHSNTTFIIKHGDRIAQAVLAPIRRANIVAVDALDEAARGDKGFGSSGV